MAGYRVGDSVTLRDYKTIIDLSIPASHPMMDRYRAKAAIFSDETGTVMFRAPFTHVYDVEFGPTKTRVWVDPTWIVSPVASGKNVGSALIAQRKLNQEQGIDKVPTVSVCQCSNRDLLTFGHTKACGRKAPIDRR